MDWTYNQVAKMIDHSLLRPELDVKAVVEGCGLANELGVMSVCVRPCDVVLAANILADSEVLVTTVVGFPHGAATKETKLNEARQALEQGARELDMVLNIGRLRSGYLEEVGEEVGAVAALAHKHQARLKLIFENSYLSLDQKIQACAICNQTGVDFAKTSTGFGSGGAEDGDLKLMRQYCRNDIGIKAAGGVRSLERLLAVRELGCTRVGATATATILEQARAASA